MEPSELETELRVVMEEVLVGLLGEANTSPPDGAPTTRLACAVSIDGSWHGRVVVSATLGLAQLTAAHMFGDDLPGPPSERDAHDALREISNIVAGNLKPLLGDHNSLGIPEDVMPNAITPQAQTKQIAHASVMHGNGVLEVSVHQPV